MSVARSPQCTWDGPARGAVGTLVGVNNPILTELVSSLGFDFLFLDLEHGGITYHDLALHAMAARVPCIARIAEYSETAVVRAADAGVAGIIVPHVRSAEMTVQVINWAHYPPAGERSVGLSRNTMLGYKLSEALSATDTPVVIAQIEDRDGVRNIEQICGVKGLGGVFVGPFDLSASLGAQGDVQSEAFVGALNAIVSSAHRAGILAGMYASTVAAWRSFQAQGCDYVVLRSDSLFLADGAAVALREVRVGQPYD